MKTKSKSLITVEPEFGYALRVGGCKPYLFGFVSLLGNAFAKEQISEQCTESYHKPVRAVVLTMADYRRLLEAAKVGEA